MNVRRLDYCNLELATGYQGLKLDNIKKKIMNKKKKMMRGGEGGEEEEEKKKIKSYSVCVYAYTT